MKIIFNPNPLCSVVELDERERQELWYKIKIHALENVIHGAWMCLDETDHGMFDLQLARSELNPKRLFNEHGNRSTATERSALDLEVDQSLAHAINRLAGAHLGDCVAFACSCSKCHAEHLLGIDTIRGLGQNEAHQIDAAFADGRSLGEAISWLANYDPDRDAGPDSWKHKDPDTWASAVPCWKAQAKRAHDWLVAYRNREFPQ